MPDSAPQDRLPAPSYIQHFPALPIESEAANANPPSIKILLFTQTHSISCQWAELAVVMRPSYTSRRIGTISCSVLTRRRPIWTGGPVAGIAWWLLRENISSAMVSLLGSIIKTAINKELQTIVNGYKDIVV